MNIKYSKEILKSLENAITVVALFEEKMFLRHLIK